jgi:hypothetical protein
LNARRAAVALALAASSLSAAALADEPDLPALNTIVTPDSPAFVQIGVSPTQIQRSTDPKAFAVAVVPAIVTQKGFGVPPGFALETAPYWWMSHPMLTVEEYQQGGLSNLLRNFSLSIASTPGAPATTAPATTGTTATTTSSAPTPQVAFGVRTTLWRGTPNTKAMGACREALKSGLQSKTDAVGAFLAHADPSFWTKPKAERDALLEKVSADANVSALKSADLSPCAKAFSLQQGFSLDLAASLALAIPDDLFDHTKFDGVSAWLTPAYFPSASDSIMGLARYYSDFVGDPGELRSLDFGVRYTHAWSSFGLGLETLVRDYLAGDTTGKGYAFRAAGTFDLLVASNVWVTLTLGRDYAPFENQPFLSLAGIKWNVDANATGTRTVDPGSDASTLFNAAGWAPPPANPSPGANP